MQTRPRIFKASLRKFVIYSLQHSETFEVSHVFLPLTIPELSMLKQVRFFGPPCIRILWHPKLQEPFGG